LGRFPVLAYYNKKYNIALWRSSEPDPSIMQKRNIDDENYLIQMNPISEEYAKLYIFSCYEKDMKGVPYEAEAIYKGTKIINYGFT
jgi:hypothetical protein